MAKFRLQRILFWFSQSNYKKYLTRNKYFAFMNNLNLSLQVYKFRANWLINKKFITTYNTNMDTLLHVTVNTCAFVLKIYITF
jgi:hypothetical protein